MSSLWDRLPRTVVQPKEGKEGNQMFKAIKEWWKRGSQAGSAWGVQDVDPEVLAYYDDPNDMPELKPSHWTRFWQWAEGPMTDEQRAEDQAFRL